MILTLKIVLILTSLFVVNFENFKFFKFFQLSNYNLKKLTKFFEKNLSFSLKFFMLIFINLCLFFTNNFYIIFALIILFLLIIFVLNFVNKKQQKNKLVFTKRFTRFFVLINLFCALYLCFACFIVKKVAIFKWFLLNFWLIFYIIFALSHILISPIENLIKLFYIKKAQKKLKKIPNLKVIAITGSFGKTSVKNFLYEMLKTKYKVCKSEKSYNTPMGITKVILNNLKFDDEILILEFGADHNHDIKKLCKIVKPNDAIITGVTNQHLETFKTMENLINTKFELVQNMDKDGIVVFNNDNEICRNFYNKCTHKNKFLISLNKNQYCSIWAENIKCDYNQTKFYLCFDEIKIFCTTSLLGKHNIANILLASKLALCLGVNIAKIKEVIKTLKPSPHRLNLIENNGKFILDDSFNANPEGIKTAIDVLKTFKGKKIVITPGLVELGNKQFEENLKLGNYLREIDYVLITNSINKSALLKGLENSKSHVFCFENLSLATKKLEEIFFDGDCVLFLNDLPDNYV